MEKEHRKAMEMERERERRIWEDNVQYQEELEKQLRDQEKARQEQYEEFLKEKLMIDEIVRKIYAEDQRYALYCTSLKVELHNGICPYIVHAATIYGHIPLCNST